MSAKWIRSRQWDDQNIPSWAWPLKFLLRAFSSIPMAVVLLSLVVVYAILASVPIGLLVLGLTYLVYGLTLVAAVGAAVVPVWALHRAWRPRTFAGLGLRFAGALLLGLALAAGAAYLWYTLAWPRLMYDPAHHSGLRLFAGFVEQYRSTTLRRLPGVEMSELEFYSWWPLRVILLLFVLNMVTATVRRIEFAFPNLGVLTVHTGIVMIGLGSIYYKGLKQEGDTILWAGEPGPDGQPTPGTPQTGFYDNTRVALWSRVDEGMWEQRPIQPPRYNDYNLTAGSGVSVLDVIGGGAAGGEGGRTLNVEVPRSPKSQVDPDIRFRLVGYASYAEGKPVWVKADPPVDGGKAQPVRFGELVARRADGPSAWPMFFLPDLPAQRLAETEVFGLEYTRGMGAQRFADLTAELPAGARHALVVEVPGRDGKPVFRGVYQVDNGTKIVVGETGYALEVKELAPQPPFPIITEGYRGATSSVAIVHIVPPAAAGAGGGKAFDRYVYHRFPEINQDLLEELNDRGMPKRRDADPGIRIAYLDASKLQVYLDERTTPDGEKPAGSVRVVVRQAAGPVRVIDHVAAGSVAGDLMPGLDIRLLERWENAREVERPQSVPEMQRDKSEIGTHGHAMLAVEVAAPNFGQVVWLPFTRYLMSGLNTERTVDLPGGKRLTLAFGRIRYNLPGFMVQLMDFQMLAYAHRGAPRDYQSVLRVIPVHDGTAPPEFRTYTHLASLNAPLQAPFHWDGERSWLANAAGTFASRLSPRQFKFSQAGWDQQTWGQTQKMVDQGQLARPYVTFTILGVGNNPGIHLIACGAILMSLGIPWAFYIKPLIVHRRKAKVQAAVAAGTYQPPAKPRVAAEPVGARA